MFEGLDIQYYNNKSQLYIFGGIYIIAIDKRQHKIKQEWDLRKLLEQYYNLKHYNKRIIDKKIKRLIYHCYSCEQQQLCME